MKAPYKLFNPLPYPKGTITQYFGENPELYSKEMGMRGHNGWDCVFPWGTPIVAVMGGKVVEVKDASTGYGKHVRILCDIGEKMLEWTYGHLSRIDVTIGQEIKEGDQIGLGGNTGFVVSGATPYWKVNPYAGTHLHLGVRSVKKWVSGSWDVSYPSGDKGLMENYDNGFKGSIDPQPFLSNTMPSYDPSKYSLTGQSIINQLNLLWAKLNALKQNGN